PTKIGNPDRRAVDRFNHQRVEDFWICNPPHCPQRVLSYVLGHVATGCVGVLSNDCGSNFGDRNLVSGKTIGINPDVDGATQPSDYRYLTDAGGALKNRLYNL